MTLPATFISPSYGRAGRVSSDRFFPGLIYVVPESQAGSYEALSDLQGGASILSIPDKYDGNVARKRNWILREFAGRNLVMVDDDYQGIFRTITGQEVAVDLPRLEVLLLNGFAMAEDAGTPLWGINVQADPKFYREYTPITFLSPVLGPFLGISADLPESLRFDEDLWLKEDYDFSLQVLRRFHRIVRLSMYHYRVDHHDLPGGTIGQRRWDEEVRQLVRLREKWGPEVVRFDLTRSVNPIVRPPLKGV